jgi:hypothetical protein
MPNILHLPCNDAVLLGASIDNESSIDSLLRSKLTNFQRFSSRLNALFLLRNCFDMPKLLYALQCASCYDSAVLSQYDTIIKQTLQVILNIDMTESVWSQATLPVSSGGLGVRLASDLALPAFLSSVAVHVL